jgi:metal-responsive CopG/Arc/MetJ family transcriptional regulator
MGLHKLEIEVDDEMLSRIDSVSARTNHSRVEVVLETLKDHLPAEAAPDRQEIEKRRAFLREFAKRTEQLGPGRTREDIDRQIQENRADRGV